MSRDSGYFSRSPWAKTYRAIASRCNKNNKYGKRGIKNYLGMTELKYLWERDSASTMKKPSIDRIDSKKDYTVDNCRFIEYSTNLNRRRYGRESKYGHGISFYKNKVYRVSFKCLGKTYHGGYFKILDEARSRAEKLWSELLDKKIAKA